MVDLVKELLHEQSYSKKEVRRFCDIIHTWKLNLYFT
jgi:hypothetical protein